MKSKTATRRKFAAEPPKPGFLPFVDPTELEKVPAGSGWAHEIKWDGYRAQAHLADGKATIYTRTGNDWTGRFGPIAAAIAELPARSAILDGEAVVVDADGVADFHGLRGQLGQPHGRILYKAFDLLWLDGQDMRPLPWRERKEALRDLLADLPAAAASVIGYVEPLEQAGARVFGGVCRLGLEGIVSKRIDAPYRGGRSAAWVKTRCAQTDTFVVIGYSAGPRERAEGLYLARAVSGELVYAGTVERGFTADDLRDLTARLRPLVQAKPSLKAPPKKPKARWVRPEILIEVSFPNASADGRLRHPKFKGFREDLERRPLRKETT